MSIVLEKATHVFHTFCRSTFDQFNGNTPDFLYHYTGRAGLTGIMKSGAFWVNDIAHLNDTSEVRYAASVLRAHVDRARAMEVNEKIVALFEEIQLKLREYKFDDIYILSLVANGDDDHLWQLYADRGQGFSFTFPTIWPLQWSEGWMLIKCQYGDESASALATQALSIIRAIYAQDIEKGVAANVRDYATLFLENIRWFAPAFKLKAWADENEWRLFRIGSNGQRKNWPNSERFYVPAPGNSRLRIAAICLGPRCSGDVAVEARKVADDNGYKGVDFYYSRRMRKELQAEIETSFLPLKSEE